MIRWRYCVVLALLLLLPKTGSKVQEDEEEEDGTAVENLENPKRLHRPRIIVTPRFQLSRTMDSVLSIDSVQGCCSSRNDDTEEDDDDEEEEDDDEPTEKVEHVAGRRAPAVLPSPKPVLATRTVKKRPLECYVCAYKSETPLRACLDPTKYRVHTITCHSSEDKCFTSVISKGPIYEAVVRGCRSGCVASPETTCCDLNRCNNQAFAMPMVPAPRSLMSSKAKVMQPSVLFFITILLLLQTVVKVAVV